jgi:hypothetical protein
MKVILLFLKILGEGGEINVTLKNITDDKIGMSLGVIGLPGGCEPRFEQLKEVKIFFN